MVDEQAKCHYAAFGTVWNFREELVDLCYPETRLFLSHHGGVAKICSLNDDRARQHQFGAAARVDFGDLGDVLRGI
jgi:hypothetical protein